MEAFNKNTLDLLHFFAFNPEEILYVGSAVSLSDLWLESDIDQACRLGIIEKASDVHLRFQGLRTGYVLTDYGLSIVRSK